MATKTIIQLTDDIDGGEASKTVTFALNGTKYELDLSDANAAKLEKALGKYIAAARKLSGARAGGRGRRPGGSTTRTTVAADPKMVRAWAASNGIAVSARGRIPSRVVEKFQAANAA